MKPHGSRISNLATTYVQQFIRGTIVNENAMEDLMPLDPMAEKKTRLKQILKGIANDVKLHCGTKSTQKECSSQLLIAMHRLYCNAGDPSARK